MQVKIKTLNGENTEEITNFSIKDEGENGISFVVKIGDKNTAPHVGITHFNNIKSKLLNEVMELLYNVVGILYEQRHVEYKQGVEEKEIQKIEEDLIQLEQPIKDGYKKYNEAIIRYNSMYNLPNFVPMLTDELLELQKDFEQRKTELNLLKKEYQLKKSEELKNDYFRKLQQLRPLAKKINEMISFTNEKYIQRLNTMIEVDRTDFELRQLEIRKNILVEKISHRRCDNSNKKYELNFIHKRLKSEADYEL
jgi:hypothetical protein